MGTATRQLQTFNHAFRRVCAQALAITVSELTSQKPEGVKTTGLTQLLNRYINTSTEGSLMDYDSSDATTDSGGFNVSRFINDAQHNHGQGHVCCLTLWILNLVIPNNQQSNGPPNLKLSSQFDNLLLDRTGHSSMISIDVSQTELAQMPQDLSTPTTQSIRSRFMILYHFKIS